MRSCPVCGKELVRKVWKGKKRNLWEGKERFKRRIYCGKECWNIQLSTDSKGNKNYFYGRHLRPVNYKEHIRWRVKATGGYIRIFYKYSDGKRYFKYEHREKMEDYLGRTLGRREIVHHIDGNKHNNEVENLLVCTPQEHKKLHLAMK